MFSRTMQQQQGDEGRRRKRVSPLSELAERLSVKLRNAEYSPTPQELEAVTKCKNEVLASSLKYPLFFGVIAGSVSYRLQVLTRAFSIAVASAFGLEFGRRKAEYACIKHFITLDGSPIKSILVDMYVLSVICSLVEQLAADFGAFLCKSKRDFPDHPLLREVGHNDSSHSEGDEASEYKFSMERKEGSFSGEARGLNTLGDTSSEYGMEDREGQQGELKGRSRHMVNRRELRIGRRQVADSRDPDKSEALGDTADILVDPFSIAVWSEVDDTPGVKQENQGTVRREVRLSRMTHSQKREHYRMLREHRERGQQRQPSNM